jgi:phosphohistidine phosphatase SixA
MTSRTATALLSASLAFFGAVAFAATAAPAGFVEKPATAETLTMLRKGGYVLYLRHGYTDNSKPDRMPAVDLNDCSTQRPLTEEGRKLAASVGASIRKAKIPVGEIQVSPLCRVKETTEAAFGGSFVVNEKLMYTANLTTEQKKPIIETTRTLLSTPVPAGSNRVLVAHGPNLMDLMGYFPKEGTVAVFRPRGADGFEYLASIPPAGWAALLK